MDNIKKFASGFVRSGVLTAGLFGLYYFHKKQIPEYMGFVSFCVTCVGIYAMSTFILEDEYDESEDDKDKEPKSVQTRRASGTPTPKMKPIRTRRLLIREEVLKETDTILDNLTDVKKRKPEEVQAEINPKICKLSKAESKETIQRKKSSVRFEQPEVIIERNIGIQNLPIHMKMPDIINAAQEGYKDIVDELRAKAEKLE